MPHSNTRNGNANGHSQHVGVIGSGLAGLAAAVYAGRARASR